MTVSTEAWIGMASLAMSAFLALVGGLGTVFMGVVAYLIKRSVDQLDKKQDKADDRLSDLERSGAAQSQAMSTLIEEVRRLRDWNHEERGRSNIRNLRDLQTQAVHQVQGST